MSRDRLTLGEQIDRREIESEFAREVRELRVSHREELAMAIRERDKAKVRTCETHGDWTIDDVACPDCDSRALVRATQLAQHLERERDEARASADREMLRVKACEQIAEGDVEGWEKLTNLCPSTAAVGALRARERRLREALADAEPSIRRLGDDLDREVLIEIADRLRITLAADEQGKEKP